ncbi:MAG: undecaprenyl/decaprenyl-phosphate alpha-N-acetylglucosaminyl 1-phosphate transferase [Planctomycetes bacterium]|nr:undecaprenyl/decaprenyl-phosphate alpha-N-acetylglucosaminyl 1-phosphate transferase [Planctomycetota bacterium]
MAGWFARRIGAIDRPGRRKIHDHPIPRLGGLAIAGAFYAVFIALWCLDLVMGRAALDHYTHWTMRLLSCALPIIVLGFVDDLRPLPAALKFGLEVLAAIVVIFVFRFTEVQVPLVGVIPAGIWTNILLVLWIVGVTNAINLTDGLDGLAAGIGGLAALAVCAMATLSDNLDTAIAAAILGGACLGFLRHNFHPAKIFMGDTGSLFIGFLLAVISVEGTQKRTLGVALALPILMLGVPIIDTLIAIFRRTLLGRSPMAPDRNHLHHLLLRLGLTQRKVVLLLYGVTALLGAFASALTFASSRLVGAVFLVFLLLAALVYRQFGYSLRPYLARRRNWRTEARKAAEQLERASNSAAAWGIFEELFSVLEIHKATLLEDFDESARTVFQFNGQAAGTSELIVPIHADGELAGELRIAGGPGSRAAALLAAAEVLDPVLEKFGPFLLGSTLVESPRRSGENSAT